MNKRKERKMNIFTGIIVLIIMWIFAFLPSLATCGVWLLIHPVSFWEKFAIIGGAAFLIGWLQVFMIIGVIAVTFEILDDMTTKY